MHHGRCPLLCDNSRLHLIGTLHHIVRKDITLNHLWNCARAVALVNLYTGAKKWAKKCKFKQNPGETQYLQIAISAIRFLGSLTCLIQKKGVESWSSGCNPIWRKAFSMSNVMAILWRQKRRRILGKFLMSAGSSMQQIIYWFSSSHVRCFALKTLFNFIVALSAWIPGKWAK